jgi:hypothetical protein
MLNALQGVAEPALSQESARRFLPTSTDYEEDWRRREALHASFWSEEPLTA